MITNDNEDWNDELPLSLCCEPLFPSGTFSRAVLDGPATNLHRIGPQDQLFASEEEPQPFAFDETVAEVFDDMVTRSVPMYREALDLLAYWANKHYISGTNIYDLGCSTGTTIDVLLQVLRGKNDSHSTIELVSSGNPTTIRMIGVDNSRPMIRRARAKLMDAVKEGKVSLRQDDIVKCEVVDASIVVMNYTLQFIAYEERLRVLRKVYNGLHEGGILFLSEKLKFSSREMQDTMTWIYEDFKRRAGYSLQEIRQKKKALKNVLVPLTEKDLERILKDAGFQEIELVLKWNNFSSFVAVKREYIASNKQQIEITNQSYLEDRSIGKDAGTSFDSVDVLCPALQSIFETDPDYLHQILPSSSLMDELNAYRKQLFLSKLSRQKELDVLAASLLQIPSRCANNTTFTEGVVCIGHSKDGSENPLSNKELEALKGVMLGLVPWRKGPYDLFGVMVDAEWRSDWKWDRIKPFVPEDLSDKVVCDIGCANGYFMFRLLAHNPRMVVGLDPNVKGWLEFHTLRHFLPKQIQLKLFYEILTVEKMDLLPNAFDLVLCLGVLYHCPDPIDALRKIFISMKPGGSIIVDCQAIAIDGSLKSGLDLQNLPLALFPRKTYAGAKGIWFLPTNEYVFSKLPLI